MTVIIACFIAGISTAVFLTLWVVTSYQELLRKRQEVIAAAEQVELHCALHRQARESPNAKAAKKMLDTSRVVYLETVKSYNHCLRKPMNRLPGWVMGFRRIPETKP